MAKTNYFGFIGVYTAIIAMLDILNDTSFSDLVVTFEVWIFFGIFIIMNSKSAKDSALKCFVFFLISQPLVYLVQDLIKHRVLNHYGITNYDELEICRLLEATEEHGTTMEGLIKFYNTYGLTIDYHMDRTLKFNIEDAEKYIIDSIDKGMPIMVLWVDWEGHWQLIIGIDTCGTENLYDDVLILADPYDVTDHYQDGYYTFPYARFFYMWREGPVSANEIPYEQPFITVYKPNNAN